MPDRAYAPAPYGNVDRPSLMSAHQATYDEVRRWDAPPVVAFRRKLAPYLFVNGVIVLFAVFGGKDLLTFTVLWSIFIAFKYAKLWSEGYDWRDVFRQPRHRELMEVIEAGGEQVKALFDHGTRARLRAERAQRRTVSSKLETCALRTQKMRFDPMRLGASPQMHQHITGLANQAMSIADNVDEALFVADEMGRLGGRSSGARRPQERG